MATRSAPPLADLPLHGGDYPHDGAAQRQWRKRRRLSSVAGAFVGQADAFLGRAGFDRGPWLAVGFAGGIGAWFLLDTAWQWIAFLAACGLAALFAIAGWRGREDRSHLLIAVVALACVLALGMAAIWARSATVGAEPIAYPRVLALDGRILAREDQPAEDRTRLTLAIRDAETGRAMKVRVNVPQDRATPAMEEGARVRLKARLMPPSPPLLPGAYDFARTAWFQGLAATGSLIGPVDLIEPATQTAALAEAQRTLSAHVRANMEGSAASIAAALASGDRGAISEADEAAMRDSGLTHLLSISGLHVSAVIAAAYFLAIKLLALSPWLALRVRLPLAAALLGALAGIGYTLLTGAEVPTVRSCVGAVLVLIALALGREPLSLRMVAVAAIVVLALWPESLVGPSFQMSFAAVIAIVALHNAGWAKRFLAPREQSWLARTARRIAMLFATGLLIEFALMPIVLFHFHRAGVYGAFANVLAIPLVTFVTMPLLALALLFDLVGAGAPAWWAAQVSLDILLGLARFTAAQPGAVKLMPQMGLGTVLVIVAGLLWLALWRGRARLLGLIPVAIGVMVFLTTPIPDILITRDGRHVGVTAESDRLLVLRDSRSGFARDNLLELAGAEGEVLPFEDWPAAKCSRDFCVLALERGGREWHLLIARSRDMVEERALAAACERADIVIADRFLPRSCQPTWLKADRRFLSDEGGTAIYLERESIRTVAQSQGEHGWWKGARGR